MHILIIEDDESIRDMLSECLADEGYQVASARHGQDALARLRAGAAPDLIILDLAMPVMNGWEFLQVQQTDASIAAIPVVVLSADRSLQHEPLPPGTSAALAKPIDVEILLDLVASYLPPGP